MKKEQCLRVIREGMVVVTADGEKLGKVTRIRDEGFEIEKGLLFRAEFDALFADVAEVHGHDIFLGCTKEELDMREEATRPESESIGRIKPPGHGLEKRPVEGSETAESPACREVEIERSGDPKDREVPTPPFRRVG